MVNDDLNPAWISEAETRRSPGAFVGGGTRFPVREDGSWNGFHALESACHLKQSSFGRLLSFVQSENVLVDFGHGHRLLDGAELDHGLRGGVDFALPAGGAAEDRHFAAILRNDDVFLERLCLQII